MVLEKVIVIVVNYYKSVDPIKITSSPVLLQSHDRDFHGGCKIQKELFSTSQKNSKKLVSNHNQSLSVLISLYQFILHLICPADLLQGRRVYHGAC